MKGIGLSLNPPREKYWIFNQCNASIIVYRVRSGIVYGGSGPKRKVKRMDMESNFEYPGGIYKMKLNRATKTLKLEFEDGVEVILDSNVGKDLLEIQSFSPIVIIHGYSIKVSILSDDSCSESESDDSCY